MLRDAGMDVASLTDHTVFGSLVQDSVCDACSPLAGMDQPGWETHGRLADAANAPGEFTAIRGFEFTTPHLGHLNVWFSEQWVDALTTGSLIDPDALLGQLEESNDDLHDLLAQLAPVIDLVPPTTSIRGFWDWLAAPVTGEGFGGGGADALCGLNHPNSYGNFENFAYIGAVADRVVSCELFNARQDYFFRGTDEGLGSPLNSALNAGWRVGMLGVTDEHGSDFDVVDGKGRAGLWVRELTREGVREALEARRFYATRLAGLRVDATAGGVRMGGTLQHESGPVRFELDIDRGPSWYGKRLLAQVLTTGPALGLPTIAAVHELRVPGPDEPIVAFTADLSVEDTPWVVLRLTDPERPADPLATGGYAEAGDGVAYASPWWLDPALAPSVGPPTAAPAAPIPGAVLSGGRVSSLPATGGAASAAGLGAAAVAVASRWLANAAHAGDDDHHHHENDDHEHEQGQDHPHHHPA